MIPSRYTRGLRGLAALALLLVAAPALAAPTVTLTSPFNNTVVAAPGSITLTASASSNYNIVSVEFYANGQLVATDFSAPYQRTWSNVGIGVYDITAVATDTADAQNESAPVRVTVSYAPTVSITAPTLGAIFEAPTSLALTANAADADGTVASVKFYVDGMLVGTDTTAPYAASYGTSSAGTRTLTAVATDNVGLSKTSTPVTITVTPPNAAPTVRFTAPAHGQVGSLPTTYAITAAAADADGTVASVAFWANGSLLSTDTSSPYSASYTASTAGSHAITAIATDNDGATSASTISLSVTPSGGTSMARRYVYDTNERLCKSVDPEAGATLIDYDLAGNVAWSAPGTTLTTLTCDRTSVTGDKKVIRTYDAMNRLTAVATPNGVADISTVYAPDGKVTTLTAANAASGTNFPVTTTYTYNKRRMLTQEESQQALYTYTLGYGYDANGFVSSMTYPDLQQVTFSPDALGRTTRVAAGATTYADTISYYPNGAIAGFRYGNGIVHTMQQNPRLLPMSSSDVAPNGTKVIDDDYDYDANGNVSAINDFAQAGLTTRAMTYDPFDRLLTANSAQQWGNATYTYDALDNVRSADQGARQYRYNYNGSNRLATIKDPLGATLWTLGYDAYGNLLSKNAQGYQFDIANRMNAVTGVQSYRYDGEGRRVQTTDANNLTTYWIYSKGGQLAYTSEARRSRNLSYVYLGNTQIATRAVAWGSGAVTVKFQHTDSLGSPVAETDATFNAATITRHSYTPYGEDISPIKPDGTGRVDGTGYTGHVMDKDTGLTYMQQRYYDPLLARFLSVDPVTTSPQNGGNFGRYTYANDNPYKFVDPDGRYSCGPKDGSLCKAIRSYVSVLKDAMYNSRNPAQRQTLSRIIQGIGKENDGKGPKYEVGCLTGRSAARNRPDGTTIVDIAKISKTPDSGVTGAVSIAHEYSHDEDRKQPGEVPNTREAVTASETKAYGVTQAVMHGLNLPYTDAQLRSDVQGSVKSWEERQNPASPSNSTQCPAPGAN